MEEHARLVRAFEQQFRTPAQPETVGRGVYIGYWVPTGPTPPPKEAAATTESERFAIPPWRGQLLQPAPVRPTPAPNAAGDSSTENGSGGELPVSMQQQPNPTHLATAVVNDAGGDGDSHDPLPETRSTPPELTADTATGVDAYGGGIDDEASRQPPTSLIRDDSASSADEAGSYDDESTRNERIPQSLDSLPVLPSSPSLAGAPTSVAAEEASISQQSSLSDSDNDVLILTPSSSSETTMPLDPSDNEASQFGQPTQVTARRGHVIWEDIIKARAQLLVIQEEIEKLTPKWKTVQNKVKKVKDKKKALAKKGTAESDEKMTAAIQAEAAVLKEREELRDELEEAEISIARAEMELTKFEVERSIAFQVQHKAVLERTRDAYLELEKSQELDDEQIQKAQDIIANREFIIHYLKKEYHVED